MDKRQELFKKLCHLTEEIDKAKKPADCEKLKYLKSYENWVKIIMKRLSDGSLPLSKGGLIGTMRAISEYDGLSSIKGLYDAAADVDLFYMQECREWQ